MLKAGEYSPNNPLVRGERPTGDVLLGLGEYERRRNTLRKLRQQQYREYLDQQAKLKQEAKEKAERERREREEKERAREERERERRQIEEIPSPVRRRASLNYGHDVSSGSNNTYITKVDTGVQVDNIARPLSVAVQTDDVGLYPVPQVHQKLTQAERELSPRVAGEQTPQKWTEDWSQWKMQERRRSYGDFDDCPSTTRKSNKDKLLGDLRHTYMPSIFDAEAIQLRNMQAEKEAAARRQYYQQELKNQILEQQRIREERKTREKMLEQAEMRRLEEQLRALRAAQSQDTYMKEHSSEYEKKRTMLQNEIEKEKRNLLRSTSQYKPVINVPRDATQTSQSEKTTSKLPLYYENKTNSKPPYSINIPETSIFSKNYDIESYLRKNLNPSRESLISNNLRDIRTENTDNTNKTVKDNKNTKENNYTDNKNTRENNYTDNKNTRENNYTDNKNNNVIIEKALVHAQPKRNSKEDLRPVLKNSPTKISNDVNHNTELSEAMQIVDDKWKVPAVQKNILKTLPKEDGKSVNILTQLGSIRRQLQLEQLKLDNMIAKDDDV